MSAAPPTQLVHSRSPVIPTLLSHHLPRFQSLPQYSARFGKFASLSKPDPPPTILSPTPCVRQVRMYYSTCSSSKASSSDLPTSNQTISSSLYAILGVEQDVELSEIKRAYRQLVLRCHPDVCAAADVAHSTHKFLQLQDAYKVLTDPVLKAEYDRHLTYSSFGTLVHAAQGSIHHSEGGRRTMTHCEDASNWKPQWEAQLRKLRWRASSPREESHCRPTSWGETMRAHNTQSI